MKDEGLSGARETMDGFDKLFKARMRRANHRLRTQYSYDIRDDPNYKKVTKIEKRMRRFYSK